MKVVALHGPGEVGSRKKLTELKEKLTDWELVTLNQETGEAELRDILSQQALFSEKRLIILENPSEGFNIKDVQAAFDVTLIVWLPKELSKQRPLYKSLENIKAEILFFPEAKERSVFPFLDLLADGKNEAYLEMKKLEEAGFDFHYLVVMIFYLLRTLLVLPKNAPSFVQKKVVRQRQKFPQEKAIRLYRELLELNFKVNSGLVEPKQANFMAVVKFVSD